MIAARLHRIARECPDASALVVGETSVTYPDLLRAGAAVRRLLDRSGTNPGDVVMVSLPISFEAVASFVACVDLGAVFLPVNRAWRESEISWLAGRVSPSAVVVRSDDQTRWLEAGIPRERLLCLDRSSLIGMDAPAPLRPSQWPPERPTAYLISSGSTGLPKIVPRTQSGLMLGAAAVATASGIGPGHRLLASVPFHHGSGFSNNLVLPLLSGATLILLEHFEPATAAAAIERHSVDYLWSSPIVYGLLADAEVSSSALRSLRVCFCGGAPLAPAVVNKWSSRSAAPIRQYYGSTETAVVSLLCENPPSPDCVGRPVPGTEIRILAGDVSQPAGQVGEIAVRGPCVLTGYVGEPGPFCNGFLRTGDRGWIDENGFLYLVGRLKPWINAGGVKVDPTEVRRVLSAMPGVRECMVEPEKGPQGVDIVAAVIAPEPGVDLTRADVIRHCRQHLAEYKIPRVMRFVPCLAADLAGKAPKQWA